MIIKVGNRVKLKELYGCECAACVQATESFHKVTRIGAHNFSLEGVYSVFPKSFGEWVAAPFVMENK